MCIIIYDRLIIEYQLKLVSAYIDYGYSYSFFGKNYGNFNEPWTFQWEKSKNFFFLRLLMHLSDVMFKGIFNC